MCTLVFLIKAIEILYGLHNTEMLVCPVCLYTRSFVRLSYCPSAAHLICVLYEEHVTLQADRSSHSPLLPDVLKIDMYTGVERYPTEMVLSAIPRFVKSEDEEVIRSCIKKGVSRVR